MTCIVGVRARGRVWIGGDSSSNSQTCVTVNRTPKVWSPTPGMLIGFSGSGAAHAAFMWRLELQRLPQPPYESWLATDFLDAVKRAFEAHHKGDDDDWSWGILIGIGGKQGGLWEIDDSSIDRCGSYAAAGSASPVALGALAVTQTIPPKTRCLWALEAAALHFYEVRRPFQILNA